MARGKRSLGVMVSPGRVYQGFGESRRSGVSAACHVRVGSTLALLAGGPSDPLLRVKRPKRRYGGHSESDSSIQVHSAQAEFFQTRFPSGALQLIELSSFQHPYQNGRGSVVSEKAGRERPKTARNGLPGRCSWFGRMSQKARILRGSGRPQRAEKECPEWADWRRKGDSNPW